MGSASKLRNQTGGQVNGLYWWHKACALPLPQGGGGKELAPPLPPTGQCAWGHIQGVAYFNGRGAQGGASLGQQHHGQSDVDTPAQKAHGHGRCALAAQAAAKAPARLKVPKNFFGTRLGLSRVIGLMQHAIAAQGANRCVHLFCCVGINLKQQPKEFGAMK